MTTVIIIAVVITIALTTAIVIGSKLHTGKKRCLRMIEMFLNYGMATHKVYDARNEDGDTIFSNDDFYVRVERFGNTYGVDNRFHKELTSYYFVLAEMQAVIDKADREWVARRYCNYDNEVDANYPDMAEEYMLFKHEPQTAD